MFVYSLQENLIYFVYAAIGFIHHIKNDNNLVCFHYKNLSISYYTRKTRSILRSSVFALCLIILTMLLL